MSAYMGLLLKASGGVLVAGAVGGGIWYLVLKDRVVWTKLDDEAFASKGDSWKWTMATTSDSTSLTTTATLTGTSGESNQKTWKCIIKGTKSKENSETLDAEEIKKQINGDFRTKTGLPQADTNASTAWTKPEEDKYARKFFNNCIRNRTKEEKKNASKKDATEASSTLNLDLIKTSENKYKFNEQQFSRIYLGVFYNP